MVGTNMERLPFELGLLQIVRDFVQRANKVMPLALQATVVNSLLDLLKRVRLRDTYKGSALVFPDLSAIIDGTARVSKDFEFAAPRASIAYEGQSMWRTWTYIAKVRRARCVAGRCACGLGVDHAMACLLVHATSGTRRPHHDRRHDTAECYVYQLSHGAAHTGPGLVRHGGTPTRGSVATAWLARRCVLEQPRHARPVRLWWRCHPVDAAVGRRSCGCACVTCSYAFASELALQPPVQFRAMDVVLLLIAGMARVSGEEAVQPAAHGHTHDSDTDSDSDDDDECHMVAHIRPRSRT